jgi:hypothetical protein
MFGFQPVRSLAAMRKSQRSLWGQSHTQLSHQGKWEDDAHTDDDDEVIPIQEPISNLKHKQKKQNEARHKS